MADLSKGIPIVGEKKSCDIYADATGQWGDLAGCRIGYVERIGALPGTREGGKASVAMVVYVPEVGAVYTEMSLELLYAAVSVFRNKFGEPQDKFHLPADVRK